MSLLNIVLFSALCGLAAAAVAHIEPCSNNGTSVCTVSEARIVPCRNPKKCGLVKGSIASLAFDFTPNFAAQKLISGVFWDTGVNEVPFAGFGSPDACLYTTCPTEIGKAQTLDYSLTIDPKWPQGTYPLIWRVKNEENEQEICCFKFTIALKKKE